MTKALAEEHNFFSAAILIGTSESICKARAEILRLARGDGHVLLTGETGTGKELAARLIHQNSIRRTRQFVPVNCAAIPDTLFESEFFGHERGAFTGAQTRKEGMFDQAHEGTLFLDEIGELPLPVQAKLLRVLDSPEFQRLGGRDIVRRDVRIVAATNRNLAESTANREFRLDLYHRIRMGLIVLPPLRDRREDIPLLIEHFCKEASARLELEIPRVHPDVQAVFMNYSWPGNVRELRNAIENALLYRQHELTVEHLPEWLHNGSASLPRKKTERERIVAILEKNRWNKERTARELGWSRATLYRKLRRHSIK